MTSATGLRKKLNPALLVGLPYREGDVMAGRYQVKDAVGVGPLGFVLRAADRELGIDVSVKLIHPRFVQTGEEREAFRRALEPARRFLHPSLTRLHDVGNDQGWPYYTYTFLDGLPLRRIIDLRLAKGQTFALDEVEPILGQLMAALEAAHPAGAHGDLKAENILVLPDMLKVTDWGVAAGVPRPPFVQAERQKSAHRHFSPEYLAGLALEPRADVYSLGVLVGELLTGLTPEDEIPELRLVNAELPDAIEGFYRRALSEHPASRFRSVREMFEAFSAVVEGKPAEAPAAPEAAVDEGFEVVDFTETQTVVVQPEPPAPVAEAAPVESPADIPPPSPVAATEVVAAMAEAPAPVVPPSADNVPPPPEAPPETEFWSESKEAPAQEASGPAEPATVATLWSDEEEEEPEAALAAPEPVAPALSLAAAAAEPPLPPAVAPEPPATPHVEPEPPAVRAIPAVPASRALAAPRCQLPPCPVRWCPPSACGAPGRGAQAPTQRWPLPFPRPQQRSLFPLPRWRRRCPSRRTRRPPCGRCRRRPRFRPCALRSVTSRRPPWPCTPSRRPPWPALHPRALATSTGNGAPAPRWPSSSRSCAPRTPGAWPKRTVRLRRRHGPPRRPPSSGRLASGWPSCPPRTSRRCKWRPSLGGTGSPSPHRSRRLSGVWSCPSTGCSVGGWWASSSSSSASSGRLSCCAFTSACWPAGLLSR